MCVRSNDWEGTPRSNRRPGPVGYCFIDVLRLVSIPYYKFGQEGTYVDLGLGYAVLDCQKVHLGVIEGCGLLGASLGHLDGCLSLWSCVAWVIVSSYADDVPVGL